MKWLTNLISRLLDVEEVPEKQEPKHDDLRRALSLLKSVGRGFDINGIDFHAEAGVALLHGDYETQKRCLESMAARIGDTHININGVMVRTVVRRAIGLDF